MGIDGIGAEIAALAAVATSTTHGGCLGGDDLLKPAQQELAWAGALALGIEELLASLTAHAACRACDVLPIAGEERGDLGGCHGGGKGPALVGERGRWG